MKSIKKALRLMPWILVLYLLSISFAAADNPPVISNFYAQPNSVYLDGTVTFVVEATDDIEVKTVYLEDVTTGIVEESNKTPARFMKEFNSLGVFKFCAYARDTSDQLSERVCINVSVFTTSECEPLNMLSADDKTVQIATKIKTKRIYKETSGFDGYPLDCCPYCQTVVINNTNCEKISGDFPDYRIIQYEYPVNTTYQNFEFPGNVLGDVKYPVILCSSRINENLSNIGIVEGITYQPLEFVYNERSMKYWIMQGTEDGKDKYFLAEQDYIGDERTYTIVDAKSYSDTVHELMKNEYYYKYPESTECHFDCPEVDPKCDQSCKCSGGSALGCAFCPPKTCLCCAQLQVVYDYNESTYKKYEDMFGRPYADYLFCYKTPLKDTAWCYQRMDISTSTVNYPWYAFTIEDMKKYTARGIDVIDDKYIDEIYKWNENAEVQEKPATSAIKERVWTPDSDCDHKFENKLFRNIWGKIFMVTPYLEDEINEERWTKTGPGAIYAGGGFRREAACWWECCRRCGKYCNCDCSPCGGICCINAYFVSGVEDITKMTVPDVTVKDTGIRIMPSPGNYAKVVNVSNGVFTVISTGNMEFTITSATFTKDEDEGTYTLTINYQPIDNYKQFVITKDIIFNYEIPETAPKLTARLDETFTTNLGVAICGCALTDSGCDCLPAGGLLLTRTESVGDDLSSIAKKNEIQLIYKFGTADITNISITGHIDNYADRYVTQEGIINITILPGIMNKFAFNIGNLSLVYSSLDYPVKHTIYRKEFTRGNFEPATRAILGTTLLYGYMPGLMSHRINSSYGYEGDTPSAVNFGFDYPEQGRSICPPECFCPEYDITDVTCGNYTTDPPTYYKRHDCICAETSQEYKRPVSSTRTYHEEETYYYDFVNLVTLEKRDLSIISWGALNPTPNVGVFKGVVNHTIVREIVPAFYAYIANSGVNGDGNTVSKVRTTDCFEECRYDVGKNPSRTSVSLNKTVWVGNRDSASVSKLDATSCDVINQSIRVGNGPRAIAADQDNNLWVGNSFDNDLWKLNGSNGACIFGNSGDCTYPAINLEGCEYPYGAVVDCRGHVWIICVYNNRLVKVNTTDGSIVGVYDIGEDRSIYKTYGINIDRHGDIWLGGAYSKKVWKVDGKTGQVICSENVGGVTRGIAVDGENNAWVADYTNNGVVKVNGSNCHQILGKYSTGTGPIGVAVDFEGNIIVPNYASNDVTKLNSSTGDRMCTVRVGEGPYTYSDMTGYTLWSVCRNTTFEGFLGYRTVTNQYILNLTSGPFPYMFNKSDFENSSITIFIHFRNDQEYQTFKLFPPRTETKSYSVIRINVTMRDQTRILIEDVSPGRYNLKPGTEMETRLRLMDAITGEPIAGENITVSVEAYNIMEVVTTDANGTASFSFVIGDKSTKINFVYPEGDRFLESSKSDYYDVVSNSRLWWFLSPDVLLLIMVLVVIVLSYRWFRGGRFDTYQMLEELRGKK